MNLQRWQKIEEIFQAALDLPSEERTEFIREKCGGDEQLRGEVEKFIASYQSEETFLESPVWTDSKFLHTKAKREIAASLEELEPAKKSILGQQIGVYKLTDELGQGGMGIVFKAERSDGEFRQKVAIKLIKRGMDTDFIIRRFRNERQILADLNHPNIARLLDGGTTKDGLPYFIMEFIEGQPFLKYCTAKSLNLRQKIELFYQICTAVVYAHKRKIIHRDIKPSNILVTEDRIPKLLDFGIAKLLDSDLLTESVAPTASQMRLMTPEYASPEQARGEAVTPASDQYSLGVLLYELITGNRPYKFPSRAPHEIARVICEEIPSEPSSEEFRKFIAQGKEFQFNEDSCQKLNRIVLKTLRKNPSERYSSIEDLTEDIAQFLSNQTVRAETFNIETGENKSPATNLKFQDGTKFITDENNLVSAEDKNHSLYVRTEKTIPAKIISPRWKGIKQGFFLMILAFLIIPFLVVFTATGIFLPQLSIFFVVLFFFGGLTRIVYALLFEEKHTTPLLPAPLQNEIFEAETKLIADSAPRKTTVENEERITAEKTIESEKTIAVLPFKNLNPLSITDSAGDFLCIGLADALISRLSIVRQFVIRPTSSVLRFGAIETDSFAAGRELNVRFVLDGNIVRTETRIRVSVQLLNVAEQSTVWAERYNEDLTDVLSVEDSISRKVAESLVPQLTTGEMHDLAKRGTDNPEAYEAYLRGRFHFNTYTDEGFRQAIGFYQKAVELDPNYAVAYAAIADYYVWISVYDVNPVSPKAKESALKAIALDDKLSEAYAALGLAQLYENFDWISSEKNLRRAVELNQNNSVAHLWLSHNIYTQKRFDEGTKYIKRALELDPLSFMNHNTYAWSFYFMRRFGEAVKLADELILKYPQISHAHSSRGTFLNIIGKTEEAIQEMQYAMKLSNNSLFAAYGLAQTLAADGQREETEKLIETNKRQSEQKYFSNFQTALCYCLLKDIDKAFDFLERAVNQRESLLVWLAVEPSLDILRGDPRFQRLLKKINHPLAEK